MTIPDTERAKEKPSDLFRKNVDIVIDGARQENRQNLQHTREELRRVKTEDIQNSVHSEQNILQLEYDKIRRNIEFVSEMRSGLLGLSGGIDKGKLMDPVDFSREMSFLVQRRTSDKKNYESARKAFLKAGEVTFAIKDVSVITPQYIDRIYKDLNKNLLNVKINSQVSSGFENLKTDLTKGEMNSALEKIDALISSFSDLISKTKYDEYENDEMPDDLGFDLSTINEAILRLEILRDDIEQKNKEHAIKRQTVENNAKSRQRKTEQDILDQEKLETIKERMLLNSILDKGGIKFHTSVPAEYSPNGFDGFSTNFDKNLQGKYYNEPIKTLKEVNSLMGGTDLYSDPMDEHDIHEAVGVILLPKEEVYEDRMIETEKRGFLGIGKKKKEIKKIKIDERTPQHADIVSGGESEDAYKFTYIAKGTHKSGYQDYSLRNGQLCIVECYLPKSVAMEVKQKINTDPLFARKIVEEIIINKAGIPEQVWKNGDEKSNGIALRPPYEKWKKDGGGTSQIYVYDSNEYAAFDQQKVHKI